MTALDATIVEPRTGLGAAARAVLDTVPEWFGIPAANDDYVAFVDANPTWSAVDADGRVVGVLAPRHHTTASSEIHLVAVARDHHRRGIGRALVDAFERRARADGVSIVQVKTLGPSDPDAGYASTRQFYLALDYVPMEEMSGLWGDTPALVMVKALRRASGEEAAIARTPRPITRAHVVDALRASGVEPGGVSIVHSSLSRLGWVIGGERAVLDALRHVIGDDGTIVMPAQTGWDDPATWRNPPVPEPWWQLIRDEMPAHDPDLTPLRGMGVVVELFRRLPGTVSSSHPTTAFVANGPLAAALVAEHPLSPGLGETSPLGRLAELDAQVVLLGVGHANNTTLHLAEHRAGMSATVTRGVPLLVDGERRWVTYDDLDGDESDFEMIGAAFATATGLERAVPLGAGMVRTMAVRSLLDFAVDWMRQHRGGVPDAAR